MDVDKDVELEAVSESAAEPIVVEATGEEPKKIRKRQKKLCSQICDQMEFYFSDANLSKDRFLKKLIRQSEDGYVDISIFAKFNKIRQLTDDMNLVAKSLGTSNMLEVNNDKKKIRRCTPIAEPKDVDERTVYVECLPLTVDHIWVRSIFEACGKVLYVSLPKYQSTGDLKGFGFVEFDSQESAIKACQMLNNPPADAPDKFGWFPRGSKDFRRLEKQVRSQRPEVLENLQDPRLVKQGQRQRTVSESAASEGSKKPRKRSRTTSEGSNGSLQTPTEAPDSAKRLKLNTEHVDIPEKPSADHKVQSESPSKVSKDEKATEGKLVEVKDQSKDKSDSEVEDTTAKKRTHEEAETGSSEGSDSDDNETSAINAKKVRISEDTPKADSQAPQAKKKTNRKRKKRNRKEKDESKKEIPELRVMTKKDWLELKTEYLRLQKSSMEQLKQALHSHSGHPAHHRSSHSQADNKENGSNMDTSQAASKSGSHIEFTPDVIIKISADTELTRKAVKDHASKLAEVAYVDIKDGATEGFIRCHKADQAAKIAASESELYKFVTIQGEEEKQYWNKLQSDRDHKLNNKTRDKKRGRDKVFKRSDKAMKDSFKQKSKHVVFEDD